MWLDSVTACQATTPILGTETRDKTRSLIKFRSRRTFCHCQSAKYNVSSFKNFTKYLARATLVLVLGDLSSLQLTEATEYAVI